MGKKEPFDYTNSSISKSILRLALPSMGASFLSSLYDLIDTFWVGHLGPAAVAGVTLAMAVFWYGGVFNDLFGTPSVILISRRYGEKDYEGARWVIGQTILSKSFLALLFLIVAYIFTAQLIRLIGGSNVVLSQGVEYLRWRLWVMPLSFSGYTVMTTFRGTGDTYKLFWVQGASAVINMVLDPIFMYMLGMGVAGAAFASDLAEIYLLIAGLLILNSKNSYLHINPFKYMKPRWEIIKKMVSLGAPTTLENFSENVAYSVILRFVSAYGQILIAALGIANRVRTISFTLGFSMNMSASTMIGQNLGAGKKDRALESVRKSMIIGELLISGYVIVLFFFGGPISYFFTPNAQVASIGNVIMKFFAVNEIFFMISMVSWGVLVAGGLTKTIMAIGLITNWGILIPLMSLFFFLHMGWEYLIFTFVIQSAAMAFMSLREVSKKKWMEKII